MPLLDHFRPPVEGRLPWPTLHNGWIANLAKRLNAIMPPEFVALDSLHRGRLEIDIGTYETAAPSAHPSGNGAAVAAAVPAVYTPPAVTATCPVVVPPVSELQVFSDDGSRNLVAAIEIVSPSNKDREAERNAFAAKCVAYLTAGVSVVVLDAVTTRRANLHNEIIRLLDAPPELEMPAAPPLYAAAYRPVVRNEKPELDVWTAGFAVGDVLPTMPLRLTGDLFVPVEFEETYTTTCRERRLML